MSYARFGWEDSDVYVYADVGGYLNCCGCSLTDWKRGEVAYFYSTQDMLDHLERHAAEGHTVPDSCIAELLDDRDKNDAWLGGEEQPSVVEARDKLVEELEAEAERDERMRELGNGGELEPHVAPGLRRAAQLVREQPSVVEGEQ